jgi:uncharacterized protein
VRLVALDLARGLALLGVALVNVHAVAVGWDSHRAIERVGHAVDLVAELAIGFFVQGRAYPTLAFLFGLGLALQWQRRDAGDPADERATLAAMRRRLWALLALGVAHALLLWPGDIVSSYAVIGLVLLWRWPRHPGAPRRWALAATGAFLVLTALTVATFVWLPGDPLPPEPTSYALDRWAGALAAHPREFVRYGLIHLTLPQLWAVAAAGLWLAPRVLAWLASGAPWTRHLTLALVVTLASWACEAMALATGQWTYVVQQAPATAWLVLAQTGAAIASAPLLLWLAARWATTRGDALRSLAEAAGRTPLTQFFGQSLVFTLVLSGWAGGLHQALGRASYTAIAFLTWLALAAFGRAWLARGHARGPVELLWHRLAQLRQPARP